MQYTDMVTRPRSLDDTIADLMGGNLTREAVQHAVAELKRLGEIRRGIELLSLRRTVTNATEPVVERFIETGMKPEMACELANRILSEHLARFADESGPHETRTIEAKIMVVRQHIFDAVVPPLPKTSSR